MKTVMKTVMKSLIPLLVVASAVAAVDVQKRVLYGRNCLDNEGKHFVVLKRPGYTGIKGRFCGGNLISQEWVLTAGHCNKSEFDVALGYHGGQPEDTMTISEESQKYFNEEGSILHDIMLIKLPRKPKQKLATIKLPSAFKCKFFSFNKDYTIIGWSYTAVDQTTGEATQKKAVKLQCGKVKLDQNCEQDPVSYNAQGKISKYRKKKILCSKDVMPCNSCSEKLCEGCRGDSGGSLVKKGGVLYGVTVGGPSKPTGETDYMDVCKYREWIKKTTGIK